MDIGVRNKVFTIIERYTGVDLTNIEQTHDLRDFLSIDSMQFVTLSSKIEDELNIELPVTVINIRTLKDLFDLLSIELSKPTKP